MFRRLCVSAVQSSAYIDSASDSDFTIEDVMLWQGMRFSLRSQCTEEFAVVLSNVFTPTRKTLDF